MTLSFRYIRTLLSVVAAGWLLLIAVGVAQACASCADGVCGGGFGCGCGCGAFGDTLNNSPGGLPSINGSSTEFDRKNIEMLGNLTMQQMSLRNEFRTGSGIWGWYDRQTGREYAIYGKTNSTAFVDVTDPANPRFLGELPTHTGISQWREVQTYKNYLYVVSDINGAHGMQIFDLHNLRNITTPQVFAETSWYNGEITSTGFNNTFNNVHTVSINEETGFAYLNGGGGYFLGSAHILSLENPLTPRFVGGRRLGYIHDGLSVVYNGPDTRYQGKEIMLNSMGQSGLSILDLTNKATPQEIARRVYENLGYTHQGWITEDHRFFVVNDEFDEMNEHGPTATHLWELSDLTNPRYLGAFLHDTVAVDHNLFIKGNLVYMSNYTSGLRVFDLSNLPRVADGTLPISSALTSVGYFDTYWQDDANPVTNFNGTWGNYPYLPSGNILVGDRQNGLFVLRLTASAASPEPATLALLLPVAAGLAWRLRPRA